MGSFPRQVAQRYGYIESATDRLEQKLQAAIAAKDWSLAKKLAAKLESAKASDETQEDAGERRGVRCDEGDEGSPVGAPFFLASSRRARRTALASHRATRPSLFPPPTRLETPGFWEMV